MYGSQGCCRLTGLGWEMWGIPPGGRTLCAGLHLWDLHVTLGGPAIEGSEREEATERLRSVKGAFHDF